MAIRHRRDSACHIIDSDIGLNIKLFQSNFNPPCLIYGALSWLGIPYERS